MTHSVRRSIAGLALVLAGGGLGVSGVVMLLRAVWMTIAVAVGSVWASTILGAALLLLGALVVSLSLLVLRRPAGQSNADLIAQITAAFLQGLSAGRSVHRR